MQITIDVSQPMTQVERELLETLLERGAPASAAPEPAEAPKPKPAKKESESPISGPVEEAVNLARSLIRGGDAASVTALLAAVGAERVSAMTTEQAEQFLAEARK